MKGDKYPPETYTTPEIRRMLASCTRGATGIRNRAIIAVLWRAGLRISATLNLFCKDVDFQQGAIRVLRGKGGKSRVVGIDGDGLALVSAWVEKRQGLGLNGDHRLFCSLAGNPLSSAYMRQLLPRLAEKAGVEKRVHPHGFRHTCAAELLREGKHIGIISQQFGHESLATTAEYLKHICPQEVVDAMRGRRWDGSE